MNDQAQRLQDGVLNALRDTTVEVNLTNVLLNLIFAAVLAYTLRWIYIRFGRAQQR